jgi:hypothetical protein
MTTFFVTIFHSLHALHQDMTEIFMDAKSSAAMLKENSAKYML